MVEKRLILHAVFWKCVLFTIATAEIINFEIRGDGGNINSPNYPSPYPLNFTCYWVIHGPEKTLIQLNFTDFNVEKNKKCLYDYVSIGNDEGEWTTKFCGDVLPPGYISTNQNLYMKFVSDKTTSSKGFKARWKARLVGEDPHPILSTKPTPTKCYTHTTITKTEGKCTESAHVTTISVTSSCSCPEAASTPVKIRTSSTNSTIRTVISSSTILPAVILGKDPTNQILRNNSIERKCAFEQQTDQKESTKTKNQNLVIVLGALLSAFFFIDALLLFLWCRLHKRRNYRRNNQGRSELRPIELKVIDGKVISTTRPKCRRVTLSDSNVQVIDASSSRLGNDGNGNVRKGQGPGILKGKHTTQEHSRLVSTPHGL